MAGNVIMVLIIFGTLFGIVYLGIASRTRIRMALIEKGADASIFNTKSVGSGNILSIILVNLALLLFGIGIGIFLGGILSQSFQVSDDVAFPGSIFTLSGLGLFAGYIISSKISRNKQGGL